MNEDEVGLLGNSKKKEHWTKKDYCLVAVVGILVCLVAAVIYLVYEVVKIEESLNLAKRDSKIMQDAQNTLREKIKSMDKEIETLRSEQKIYVNNKIQGVQVDLNNTRDSLLKSRAKEIKALNNKIQGVQDDLNNTRDRLLKSRAKGIKALDNEIQGVQGDLNNTRDNLLKSRAKEIKALENEIQGVQGVLNSLSTQSKEIASKITQKMSKVQQDVQDNKQANEKTKVAFQDLQDDCRTKHRHLENELVTQKTKISQLEQKMKDVQHRKETKSPNTAGWNDWPKSTLFIGLMLLLWLQ